MPNQASIKNGIHLLINALFLIVIIGGVYTSLQMNGVNRSLWLDEAMLASSFSKRSFLGIFLEGEFEYLQSAPLNWLWFEKLLAQFFGNTPYVLRMGSVIAYLLTIIASVFIQAFFYRSKFPLSEAALFANTPFILQYSNVFKPYMMDGFVTLAILVLYGLYRDGRLKWLSFGCSCAFLLWCSQPACFIVCGCVLCELFVACKHRSRSEVRTAVAIGAIAALSFVVYYFAWARRMTSIAGMQDYWDSSFLPLIPRSVEDLRTILRLFNVMFSQFDHATCFVMSLSIAACVYAAVRRDKIMVAAFLGIAVSLFASSLHLYPVEDRLWCFSYPVFILAAFTTFEGIVQKGEFPYVVAGLAMVVVVFLNSGIQTYSASSSVYWDGEEIGAEMEYLEEHMAQDDLIYVYKHSVPGFEYINGYGNASFGKGSDNVLFGQTFFTESDDCQDEIDSLVAYPNLWIASSHITQERTSRLFDAMRDKGYLELVHNDYNTPLWHYCLAPTDRMAHASISVPSISGAASTQSFNAVVTIHNDGEAYLGDSFNRLFLTNETDGAVYAIDGMVAPGESIDVPVRFEGDESPLFMLRSQYGKPPAQDMISR